MASRSGSQQSGVLPQWIRPLHRCWKPLTWIWGGFFFGAFVNIGSSWLITKNLDFGGTPVGWGMEHPWVVLPSLFLLVLLTLLAGLAWTQEQEHAFSPASSLTLAPKQRLQFIRGFQQEYTNRLNSSLQGQVALELHLQERTDIITSSANLVFHQLETGEAAPLPAGTSIIQVYDRVQRGLLILGAPGSGKTTLLLELAQELLQRAENDLDQAIAIILNLSSWARTRLPLEQWLIQQCSLVYGIPKQLGTAWIAQEQVQFLLDGLDEVGASARTACIEAINVYRQTHFVPLVVCSRSQEYTSQPGRLILTGAVEIRLLESAQIWDVLKRAGKSFAAVRTALRSNAILSDLLTTPLMLSIVLLTYRDKTTKELPQKGSPEEQQREICEQYVQRMLKRYRQLRAFSPQQSMYSLSWLAQQMGQHQLTEFHLESLQADWLRTRHARIIYRLSVGLFFGLLYGLFGSLLGDLLYGLFGGLLLGLISGLSGGLGFGLRNIELVENIAWTRESVFIVLLSGLFFCLFFGLIGGQSGVLGLRLLSGLFFGLYLSLSVSLSRTSLDGNMRLKPNQRIYLSGWNALRLSCLFFLLSGLSFGLLLNLHLFLGIVISLLVSLSSGLSFGGAAYVQHYVLRLVLASSHVLPWRAVPFLEEATACILLQRVGGGYRFIHPLLQEYFASLPDSLTKDKPQSSNP